MHAAATMDGGYMENLNSKEEERERERERAKERKKSEKEECELVDLDNKEAAVVYLNREMQ